MSGNSLILAIETSQREGSVAVGFRGQPVHVESLAPRRGHDDDLMPAIQRLFARLSLEPRDLAGGSVAVSCGPGGFTGLRIAATTAKMFAESLGTAIIAVPSALVAAEPLDGEDPIIVALACKDQTFWSTRLHRVHGHWELDGEPRLATIDDLALGGVRMVLADEFFPVAARASCQSAGIQVLEPRFSAANCLTAAQRLKDRGLTIGAVDDVLIYARQPEAVSLWDKRHPR